MAKRLADIINVIGATAYTVPKEVMRVPFPSIGITYPTPLAAVPTETIKFEPFKPRNIYELAEQVGLPARIFHYRLKKWVPSLSGQSYRLRKESGRVQSYEHLRGLLEEGAEISAPSHLYRALEIVQKYPMTKEQARSLVYTLGRIGRRGGKIKEEEFLKVIFPSEELTKVVRSVLEREFIPRFRTKVEEVKRKIIPEKPIELPKIKTEELRLYEPVWLRTYRGETLAKQAEESAEEYNRRMTELYNRVVKEYNENVNRLKQHVQDASKFLTSVTKPETVRNIAFILNAPMALEAVRAIYESTGGKVDVSSLVRQILTTVTESKEFLNQLSNVYNNLFNIKIDLLAEISEAVRG